MHCEDVKYHSQSSRSRRVLLGRELVLKSRGCAVLGVSPEDDALLYRELIIWGEHASYYSFPIII